MIRGVSGGVSFSVGARRLKLPAGPPPTPRVLVGGLVRFIVAALVVEAALLGLAAIGMPIAGIVVMFLAGVPIGLWVARHVAALRFPAILMMPALAVFSMILIHEPPAGAVASGPPQLLAQAPLVGGYRDHGLRVVRELAGEQLISGRGGSGGTMTVAPLVGPGWNVAEPVANWAVGTAFRSGRIGPRHPDRWQKRARRAGPRDRLRSRAGRGRDRRRSKAPRPARGGRDGTFHLAAERRRRNGGSGAVAAHGGGDRRVGAVPRLARLALASPAGQRPLTLDARASPARLTGAARPLFCAGQALGPRV